MSLSNRSAPRPTVKIGTDFARSDSSSSPIGARELSAPSLSDDEPRQRNRVQLLARLLDCVADVRLAGVERQSRHALSMRCAPDEKRNSRTMNFFAQRLEQRAVRSAERVLDPSLRGFAVAVGDAHAPRVVDQHADVVALRNRRRQQQHRPEAGRPAARRAPRRAARPAPTDRAACSCRARRRNSGPRARRSRPPRGAASTPKTDAPKRQVALGELRRPVLEQELKNAFEPMVMRSIATACYCIADSR